MVESTRIVSEFFGTLSKILVLPATWNDPDKEVESKEISYKFLFDNGLNSTLKIEALTVPTPLIFWNKKLPLILA
jgi:hypothetical protein